MAPPPSLSISVGIEFSTLSKSFRQYLTTLSKTRKAVEKYAIVENLLKTSVHPTTDRSKSSDHAGISKHKINETIRYQIIRYLANMRLWKRFHRYNNYISHTTNETTPCPEYHDLPATSHFLHNLENVGCAHADM